MLQVGNPARWTITRGVCVPKRPGAGTHRLFISSFLSFLFLYGDEESDAHSSKIVRPCIQAFFFFFFFFSHKRMDLLFYLDTKEMKQYPFFLFPSDVLGLELCLVRLGGVNLMSEGVGFSGDGGVLTL
jgi:hypothetical protein